MSITHAAETIGIAVLLLTAPMFRFMQAGTSAHGAVVRNARDRNVQVMLELFRAIEERDPQHRNVERELSFYQADVEFHWPPALPYGGTFRGLGQRNGANWSATWTPLQPTAAERRMDPQVVGADEHQVAILYHQRGISPKGERFDGEVIGLYELRDFKLARAQMFYFDEAACARFLEQAASERQKITR
jgi:ketosteroid isomerase-like protein